MQPSQHLGGFGGGEARGILLDVSDNSGRNLGGAVPALQHPAVEATVPDSPACHRGWCDALRCGKGFDAADDLFSGHSQSIGTFVPFMSRDFCLLETADLGEYQKAW